MCIRDRVDAKYTIYHISAPVGTGKSQRVINLGLAVGDLTLSLIHISEPTRPY